MYNKKNVFGLVSSPVGSDLAVEDLSDRYDGEGVGDDGSSDTGNATD